MKNETINTNDSLDSLNLLDCFEENDENINYKEEDDEVEDCFSKEDSWYEEDDFSDEGCGEGYSCYNCPNLGCPSNAWN